MAVEHFIASKTTEMKPEAIAEVFVKAKEQIRKVARTAERKAAKETAGAERAIAIGDRDKDAIHQATSGEPPPSRDTAREFGTDKPDIAPSDPELTDAVWEDFFAEAIKNDANLNEPPCLRTLAQNLNIAKIIIGKYQNQKGQQTQETCLGGIVAARSDAATPETTIRAGLAIMEELANNLQARLKQDPGFTQASEFPKELLRQRAQYAEQVSQAMREQAMRYIDTGHHNEVPVHGRVVGPKAIKEKLEKLIAGDPWLSSLENAVNHYVGQQLLGILEKHPHSSPGQMFASVAEPHGDAKELFYAHACDLLEQTTAFTKPGTEDSFAQCRDQLLQMLDSIHKRTRGSQSRTAEGN